MQKVTDALFSLKEATAPFAHQGFVTMCFLIFIVDEVKNFAANIFFKLVCQSRTGSRAYLVSHVLEFVQKGWRSYIEEFRGSEAVEGSCCEFIYGIVKSRDKGFVLDLKLLFTIVKVSSQVFYYEISLFHWFSQVIISCLIYYSIVHDFDMILMLVCFIKVYS